MRLSVRPSRARLLGIGFAVLLVYRLTAAPSLTWSHWGSDGGDFITAAVTGRVPHPPGFPIWFALSRIAVALFPSDPARVLNGLSGAAACGAVLFVAAVARHRGASECVAVTAALALAFSPWFWSQALITEVYTTTALLAALVIWLREWARECDARCWILVGAGLGLAVSAHLTAVFLLPYVVLGARPRWRGVLLGFALGLLPYGLLPLSGPWPQPWGDLRSLGGWLEFVSARIYWGNAFGLLAALWPSRLLAWAVLSVRQFTPAGALLVIVGLVSKRPSDGVRAERDGPTLRASAATSPKDALGALVSMGLVSIYAIGYNSADSWVYLVAYMPLSALLLAAGLDALAERGVPAALGLLLPIALLALNVGEISLAHDREATAWLDGALAQLPDSAVVLTSDDRHTFALWYAVEGARFRADLTVVDERLWGFPFYEAFLLESRCASTGGETAALASALAANGPGAFAAGETLCTVDPEGEVRCR